MTYTYDSLDRVLTENVDGVRHRYVYDANGNRIRTVIGKTARTIQSVYDDANRLKSMTENGRTTAYQYDLNGNITTKILPNGDTETNTYDDLNRTTIQYITSVSSQILCRYKYTYDNSGSVLSIQETYPTTTTVSNRTVTNTYDAGYRLLTESNAYTGYNLATPQPADTSTAYTYDTNNNRLTKTVTGGTAPTSLWYY